MKEKFENDSFERVYAVARNGLPNWNDKLLRDEPIVVAFLGGSITEGFGASDPEATSWRALTETYLKRRFPDKTIHCVNAGVGGTTNMKDEQSMGTTLRIMKFLRH
jgi:acyl-CoA thioesterase I